MRRKKSLSTSIKRIVSIGFVLIFVVATFGVTAVQAKNGQSVDSGIYLHFYEDEEEYSGNTDHDTSPNRPPGSGSESDGQRPGGASGVTVTEDIAVLGLPPELGIGVLPQTGGNGLVVGLFLAFGFLFLIIGSVLYYYNRKKERKTTMLTNTA